MTRDELSRSGLPKKAIESINHRADNLVKMYKVPEGRARQIMYNCLTKRIPMSA